MPYSYTSLYYSHPIQVTYLAPNDSREGIVYRDTLIDLKTGQTYIIDDYINMISSLLKISFDDVIVEHKWLSLV